MKLISWNVNGLRACCDKGFRDVFAALDADFCRCRGESASTSMTTRGGL